jgi:hypothetical protein
MWSDAEGRMVPDRSWSKRHFRSSSMMHRRSRLQYKLLPSSLTNSHPPSIQHEHIRIHGIPPCGTSKPGALLASPHRQAPQATSPLDWRPWHQAAASSRLSSALKGRRPQDSHRRRYRLCRCPGLLNGTSPSIHPSMTYMNCCSLRQHQLLDHD